MASNVTISGEGMESPKPKRLVRYAAATARVLMGLLFTFAGLNGLLNFLPPPPPDAMPEAATAFMGAMMQSGYMFQLVAITQLAAGALFLANRFVPLALALLAPIIVNIVAFHLFLAPTGLGIAILVLLMELGLAWVYRKAFRPMLAMRVRPE